MGTASMSRGVVMARRGKATERCRARCEPAWEQQVPWPKWGQIRFCGHHFHLSCTVGKGGAFAHSARGPALSFLAEMPAETGSNQMLWPPFSPFTHHGKTGRLFQPISGQMGALGANGLRSKRPWTHRGTLRYRDKHRSPCYAWAPQSFTPHSCCVLSHVSLNVCIETHAAHGSFNACPHTAISLGPGHQQSQI